MHMPRVIQCTSGGSTEMEFRIKIVSFAYVDATQKRNECTHTLRPRTVDNEINCIHNFVMSYNVLVCRVLFYSWNKIYLRKWFICLFGLPFTWTRYTCTLLHLCGTCNFAECIRNSELVISFAKCIRFRPNQQFWVYRSCFPFLFYFGSATLETSSKQKGPVLFEFEHPWHLASIRLRYSFSTSVKKTVSMEKLDRSLTEAMDVLIRGQLCLAKPIR